MSTRESELAWAAGFFDGEGCTSATKMGGSPRFPTRRYPLIGIAQVDRAVLDRFRDAVGFGKVTGPYEKKNPNARPQYRYSIQGFVPVTTVMARLWPWLGEIKRQQARSHLLAFIKTYGEAQ